jgi:hypothetical protein
MSLGVAPWLTERFDVDVKLSSPAGVFCIYWLTQTSNDRLLAEMRRSRKDFRLGAGLGPFRRTQLAEIQSRGTS